MWFRNREIHDRSGWSYWARKNWWILMRRSEVRVIRDEDMPEELKHGNPCADTVGLCVRPFGHSGSHYGARPQSGESWCWW